MNVRAGPRLRQVSCRTVWVGVALPVALQPMADGQRLHRITNYGEKAYVSYSFFAAQVACEKLIWELFFKNDVCFGNSFSVRVSGKNKGVTFLFARVLGLL